MYKLINTSIGKVFIQKTVGESITTFGQDEANTDYQEYLEWVAEGNEPEPAE